MVAKTPTPTDPVLITGNRELKELAARLRETDRVALDTEAASYHRYVDRIYLIQVSSTHETAIIDPLGVTNLKPIGSILADPAIEVVFHDADYDLRVFDRDYRFHARNLFDTRIAAQFLAEPGVGLGPLLEKYFGVKANKKLQRADWSRRPLSEEMIAYAAMDTQYLSALRDELARQLKKQGRLAWAQEEFVRLESVRWTSNNDANDAFLRLKGAKSLSPRSLAVLRSVHQWRENMARDLDRAPFRVLGNEGLVELARAAPTSRSGLRRVSAVPASTQRRYGDALVDSVKAGLSVPQAEYPKVTRAKRMKTSRAAQMRLSRLKTLRAEVAEQLGIEVGVLCPNGALQSIARAAPESTEQLVNVPDLRRWQIEALGSQRVLTTLNGGD